MKEIKEELIKSVKEINKALKNCLIEIKELCVGSKVNEDEGNLYYTEGMVLALSWVLGLTDIEML